ncbi:MAG TPA: hypothetical protein DDZ22_03170, partial [Massilia sp.]|nr:hypothetical protein [Massilia sp.]
MNSGAARFLPGWLLRAALLLAAVILGAGVAHAQQAAPANAIESISANQQGPNVVLNIAMREAPAKLPLGFAITNPARIALDFGATANATGKSSHD